MVLHDDGGTCLFICQRRFLDLTEPFIPIVKFMIDKGSITLVDFVAISIEVAQHTVVAVEKRWHLSQGGQRFISVLPSNVLP